MPRRAISLALIAAVACPAIARAQSTPPSPGPAKNFAVPARHDLTLPNGMQVTLVPYGTVPLATVSLNIRTGEIDESADQVWLSRLMSDMLLQGTTTRSSTAIAEAAGGMGGEVTVQPGVDEINLTGEVLGDSAAPFTQLIADVARNASFPDSELARVRGDLARNLAIALSRPGNQVSERFSPLVYGDHPYGRPFPTPAALGAYTTQQVRDFYRTNVGAARAHLYVVGRFDVGAVERAARDAFGDWAAGAPPTAHPPTPHAGRTVVLIDRPGAVQSTLRLGLPVPDPTSPDWIGLQVTDALLGGSFASRITSNIREQKGYTYSPFSNVTSHKGVAVWTEQADVTTNVTGASLKEIFKEIDRLRSEPPSAAELRGIQNYLAGLFVLRSSSTRGLVNQLDFVDFYGLPADYLSTYVGHVYAVTPADVEQTAKAHLDPDRMVIVVAGDKKTVADQLTPYGPVVQ
jgi:zinc protease